jgi:predicted  nucleic acid-binding Zn-ribbon protein
MAVVAVTDLLRTLHRMHRQLADLRDRLAAGPRQVAAFKGQLAAGEAGLASATDAVKQAKMSADAKQLQLRSAESKQRDLEGKLNACKTNREYQTLKEQIAADSMAMQVLEDEILEALERIDSLKKELPVSEQKVAQAKKLLAEREEEVRRERASLDAEVARIEGELEAAERDLPADVRETYRRAVKTKAADGMAPIDGENCGGCFQRITDKMMTDILLGRMVICRSCGRVLYPQASAAGDSA